MSRRAAGDDELVFRHGAQCCNDEFHASSLAPSLRWHPARDLPQPPDPARENDEVLAGWIVSAEDLDLAACSTGVLDERVFAQVVAGDERFRPRLFALTSAEEHHVQGADPPVLGQGGDDARVVGASPAVYTEIGQLAFAVIVGDRKYGVICEGQYALHMGSPRRDPQPPAVCGGARSAGQLAQESSQGVPGGGPDRRNGQQRRPNLHSEVGSLYGLSANYRADVDNPPDQGPSHLSCRSLTRRCVGRRYRKLDVAVVGRASSGWGRAGPGAGVFR